MIRTILLVGLWNLSAPVGASNGIPETEKDSLGTQGEGKPYELDRRVIKADFMEETYLHFSLEHVLSNFHDFTTYQLETTGEFSSPDRYTFSFNGNSYRWNRYKIDNHRIDDIFFPGSSLHKILLFETDLELDNRHSQVSFTSGTESSDRIFVNWNSGSLGSRIPFADEYIHFWHGHNSSFEDAYQPIIHRKKTAGSGLIYFSKDLGRYDQKGYLNFGRRNHTSYGPDGISEYYPEEYRQLYLDGRYDVGGGIKEVGYLLSYNSRDNLFAEFNYGRAETARFDQLNTSLFARTKSYTTGFNIGYNNIRQNNPGFSRNVIDQDGEGSNPWYPDSRSWHITYNHSQSADLGIQGLIYSLELSNTLAHQTPYNSEVTNALYHQKFDSPFVPLQVTNWTSASFYSALLENSAGLLYATNPKGRTGALLSADLTFDGFVLRNKSFSQVNYQFEISGYHKPMHNLRLALTAGRNRIPFHYDYIRFFSDDYLSGQTHFWNDANGDQVYQNEEQGRVLENTGGLYHQLGDQLSQPAMFYVDLEVDWTLGGNWSLLWTGQYRSYRNLWTNQYTLPVEEVGTFLPIGTGRDVFFLNGSQENRFLTVPLHLKSGTDGGKPPGMMWDNPYYLGAVIKIEKRGRLFLSASFASQMAVGVAGFGNGVLHNDPDVLTESTANPNSQINHMGRLDSDRAYIVRSLVGYKITKGLSMSFQLLYRDGQPTSLQVATISGSGDENQAGLWNVSPKGTNPATGEFGYREPGFWNYELRTRYVPDFAEGRLSFNLYVYNLFDVATTLNYYNFAPGEAHETFTLDTQIPRGFMIGMSLGI